MWSDSLESVISAREDGDIVVARDAESSRQYRSIPVSGIEAFARAQTDDVLYEVVTDGHCYLHFLVPGQFDEEVWADLGRAIVDALPDVETIEEMAPSATASAAGTRIVYRDIVLSAVEDNERITAAVQGLLDERGRPGLLATDLYRRGYCALLRGRPPGPETYTDCHEKRDSQHTAEIA